MELHGGGVREREGKRGAFAARRTDRAEEISVLIALIGRLARTRTAFGPLSHEAVFLTYARFVLEPDFDWRAPGNIGEMGAQRLREVFLYASTISAFWPG